MGFELFSPTVGEQRYVVFHVSRAMKVEQAGHRVCEYGFSILNNAGELQQMPVQL
jgi:hypothetical protein